MEILPNSPNSSSSPKDFSDYGDTLFDTSENNNNLTTTIHTNILKDNESIPINIKTSENEENEKSNSFNKKKTIFDNKNDPFQTPHYEIDCTSTQYDFFFEKMNYHANNKLSESKGILTMPKYLRNTLFFRSKKIKDVRKKTIGEVYIIASELKNTANDFYHKNDYFSSLERYNLIYSLFKWIQFKDKSKENLIFQNLSEIYSNPITDDDIVKKSIKVNKENKNDYQLYKSMLANCLKGMANSYVNLRQYTEARKCLDEAITIGYPQESLPQLYLKRGQIRMLNKYSSVEELNAALDDFKLVGLNLDESVNAKVEEYKGQVRSFIRDKKCFEKDRIKKLLHNFRYAYNVIKEKKIKMDDKNQDSNYSINKLYYKILIEIKDTYLSTLKKYYQKKNLTEFNKGIKEFDEFLESFHEYDFFYTLDINKINDKLLNELSSEEKKDISLIKMQKSLKNLFDEFKYKKCDSIYMNMKFNTNIWDSCYETVLEQQKLLGEFDDNNSKYKKDIQNEFVQFINKILRFINLEVNQTNYKIYICIFLIIVLIVVIIAHSNK